VLRLEREQVLFLPLTGPSCTHRRDSPLWGKSAGTWNGCKRRF